MSGCGKFVFSSRAEAKAHVREAVKRGGTSTRPGGTRKTYPYRCLDCGMWHLTSQSPREQRRRRRWLP